jgi:hypothetical protein
MFNQTKIQQVYAAKVRTMTSTMVNMDVYDMAMKWEVITVAI